MPIRLDARAPDFAARFRAFLDTKREAAADVEEVVRAILADVAARGDPALIALTQKYDRKRTEFQDDVSAAQQDVLERIGRKMVDVLDRYARENGFSVILDTSGQNSPILFASNQVDVTQDIIRLYDQSYPVKNAPAGTTATPKPATPKPATPPPTKPQQ